MIKILNIKWGRFSNRLLHYNFLRQISILSNVEFICDNSWEGIKYFKCPFTNLDNQVNNNSIILTDKDILKFKKEDFIQYVKEHNDIILQPPLMGELFHIYTDTDPNEFLKLKDEFKIELKQDKFNVGIHFRGTDFHEWNIKACLSFTFYKKSIDLFEKEKTRFYLFTDDKNYSSFVETLNYLKENNYYYEIGLSTQNGGFIHDFSQLINCDGIISTPSTFSLWGGILGKKNKKIIQSKEWIDYRIKENDPFWIGIRNNINKFYKIWMEI